MDDTDSVITSDESYLAMLTVPSTPVEDNATSSITALNSRGAGVIVSDSDGILKTIYRYNWNLE